MDAPEEVSKEALLQHQAQLLKESPLLTTDFPNNPNATKRLIFLTLADIKPVSFGEAVKASPEDIKKLMNQLALAYDLQEMKSGIKIFVSKNKETLETFMKLYKNLKPGDSTELGKMLGFPETAIEGFGKDNPTPEEQKEVIDEYLDHKGFYPFMPSKTHMQEELLIIKKWYEILKKYGLI